MTRSLLLVSLAAGSLTVPVPAASAATEPAIRSITVRPSDPVVGAHGSVRLVIDVIAKGARGKDGVTVKVEPGAPPVREPQPRPVTPPIVSQAPAPVRPPAVPPAAPPAHDQLWPPADEQVRPPAQEPGVRPNQDAAPGPAHESVQEGAQEGVQEGAQGSVQAPAQEAAGGHAQTPVRDAAQAPVLAPGKMPRDPALTPVHAARPSPVVSPGPVPPAAPLTGSVPSTAVPGGTSPKEDAQPVLVRPRPVPMAPVVNGQPAVDDRPVAGVQAPGAAPGAAPGTGAKVGVTVEDTFPLLPPRIVWRRITAPPARMADGWQTWRFLPDKRLNRYYPAGTWTITATAKGKDGTTVTEYATFELRRQAKLSSVRVEKSARPNGVRLRGSLTRVDPRGLTDFGPFAKQRLELLWRPDANSPWETVGETTTDAAGAFAGTIEGRTAGEWRVRYPGTGHYSADLSKIRQITR
ncbi:hypothetical protein AB0C27_36940 [Nonomuraea sp. NPDC048882]|uniref:hypothetical protein n=1 Tax=Nonomuraea sp. NPDC048882 TaxID=3154347 RepID=UPI0033EE2D67